MSFVITFMIIGIASGLTFLACAVGRIQAVQKATNITWRLMSESCCRRHNYKGNHLCLRDGLNKTKPCSFDLCTILSEKEIG